MLSYSAIQERVRARLDTSTLLTAYLLSTVNSALLTVRIATAPLLTIATLALMQMQSWIQLWAQVREYVKTGFMT